MEIKNDQDVVYCCSYLFILGKEPVLNWSVGKWESSLKECPIMHAVGSHGKMLSHCEDKINYSNFIHLFEYLCIIKESVKDLTPVSR